MRVYQQVILRLRITHISGPGRCGRSEHPQLFLFILFSFFFPHPSSYSFLTPLSFILQSGLFSFSRLILVIRQTMSDRGPPRPLRPFVPRTLQDTPTAGPVAKESKIRRASTACIECQRCRTKVPFPFEARPSFGISWC